MDEKTLTPFDQKAVYKFLSAAQNDNAETVKDKEAELLYRIDRSYGQKTVETVFDFIHAFLDKEWHYVSVEP